MASRRPEHMAPATEFYSAKGAAKYAASSRMSVIQTALATRCFELLALPPSPPALLLDIGTGTGIAGNILSDQGHHWVGSDVSENMLQKALDDDVPGDLMLADAGDGVPFRMGCFDGAVSVSAIQWLCNADRTEHNPWKRMNAFFATLYAALRKSARAVLQFYPENVAQVELLTAAAMRAGFSGGLLVDYPNSAKAKKYFLVLTAGPPAKGVAPPKPLGVEEDSQVKVGSRRLGKRARRAQEAVSNKDWVISKKERRRRQGHQTKPDSKYTGRKRRVQF
ncbi:unnamed protein product [Chondrus crispus]|uniref:18S rRNA (Guanine-N(7))-methyltransferase n=1 Tax=Chondrus crispus TaxID=2769 RepID=R7QCK9_CHOCR|nr:unnamed protein product [Chondrus crispus]CDF35166.1 unnamed protein product [Chondrus crispus]|eukprot:XP_005714985.1 unnamed protein product [Chondrus crispus]